MLQRVYRLQNTTQAPTMFDQFGDTVASWVLSLLTGLQGLQPLWIGVVLFAAGAAVYASLGNSRAWKR